MDGSLHLPGVASGLPPRLTNGSIGGKDRFGIGGTLIGF